MKKSAQEFLDNMVNVLKSDSRFLGCTIGGSWITNEFDDFSDLDILIVSNEKDYNEVLNEKSSIASSFGNFLSGFTGEHFGDSRVLVCMYNNPLLHVDLKFITLSDLSQRIENPEVLYEVDEQLSDIIKNTSPKEAYIVDYQWVEDRFWTWVHYCAVKIARGELFASRAFIDYLGEGVLSPMAKQLEGIDARGFRRIESQLPEFSKELQIILSSHNQKDYLKALLGAVSLYRKLRKKIPSEKVIPDSYLEHEVMIFIDNLDI